jgi:hypothetical protein
VTREGSADEGRKCAVGAIRLEAKRAAPKLPAVISHEHNRSGGGGRPSEIDLSSQRSRSADTEVTEFQNHEHSSGLTSGKLSGNSAGALCGLGDEIEICFEGRNFFAARNSQ